MKRELVVVSWVLFLALMVAPGCNDQLSPQAMGLLRSARDSYDAGDNVAAASKLDTFLAENATSSKAAEAFYLRGMARLKTSDRAGAKQDLQSAIAKTGDKASDKALRAKARVALGDIAYDDGDMALAENMYRQALEDFGPGAKPSGHAHYRLGCVLQRQGRWKEADVQFDRVVFLLPGTGLARKSARRTHGTSWTIQAGLYKSKVRAAAVARSLSGKHLSAAVVAIIAENRPMFVVRVGRFATYEQAAAMLPQVRHKQKDAFVTPTR